MATRKKKTTGPTVSVTLPGDIKLECGLPTQEQWDRFLDKLKRGEDKVARRELIQVTAVSHKPEGAAKILDRYPALPLKLASHIDDLATGDLEVTTDIAECTVTIGDLVLNGPDGSAWESFQTKLENPKTKFGPACREFLRALAVDPVALDVAFRDTPAILGPLIGAVGEVAGAGFTVEVKKG